MKKKSINLEDHSVLTKQEVMALLRISRHGVDRLLKEKRLAKLQLGRRILIPKKALNDFIDSASTK